MHRASTRLVSNYLAKRVILTFIKAVVKKTATKWDDLLWENKVFDRLANVVPALIIYSLAEIMFPEHDGLKELTRRVSVGYMILVSGMVVTALLSTFQEIYDTWDVSKKTPITSYVQAIKIIVIVFVGVLVISALLDSSPWVFISGIGALTAVIILVFKDTILGFVASIQLTANDMVRPGDWIEMPKYGADGDVIEVTINTIKVQNWDKTITTIPTYSLISDSFKNWRGMSESGGRRIKRAIRIDMNSVKFCDSKMLEKFKKIKVIRMYIEKKEKELQEYNRAYDIDALVKVNGRRLTNLGTFRAYIREYLRHNPKIHSKMTLLVRHLDPRPDGIPIEIYAFSSDQEWANFEDLQADIFDHILAVLPEFELKAFQYPTGMDLAKMSGLCNAGDTGEKGAP